MAGLSLRHIYKIYPNGVPAVNDFNLEIEDKEFIVIVGPSGCGKSTTLRMVAGLEKITDGELYIGDKLVNDVEPKDRDIAMVFQNYALYPHMTVYDNMAFGLKLKKVSKEEIGERVRAAAKILEIEQYLDRKPKALSGGQRQRVAIGRAIVRNPQVFLMDEPLSNLDAKLRNQMRSEIILLRKRINTTFIYVTHDQTEAMTLGDRIVIMKDGDIQQIGTPQEVFDHPRNIFVAGFIGAPQMNFFDAELVVDEKPHVELLGTKIYLTEAMCKEIKEKNVASQKVTLGSRPEHILLADGEGDGKIKVKVSVSEMMGSEIHLHLDVSDEKSIIVRVPTISMTPEKAKELSYGNDTYIEFNPKACHIFNEDGVSIFAE